MVSNERIIGVSSFVDGFSHGGESDLPEHVDNFITVPQSVGVVMAFRVHWQQPVQVEQNHHNILAREVQVKLTEEQNQNDLYLTPFYNGPPFPIFFQRFAELDTLPYTNDYYEMDNHPLCNLNIPPDMAVDKQEDSQY